MFLDELDVLVNLNYNIILATNDFLERKKNNSCFKNQAKMVFYQKVLHSFTADQDLNISKIK